MQNERRTALALPLASLWCYCPFHAEIYCDPFGRGNICTYTRTHTKSSCIAVKKPKPSECTLPFTRVCMSEYMCMWVCLACCYYVWVCLCLLRCFSVFVTLALFWVIAHTLPYFLHVRRMTACGSAGSERNLKIH